METITNFFLLQMEKKKKTNEQVMEEKYEGAVSKSTTFS
jgi:hypothetical protein